MLVQPLSEPDVEVDIQAIKDIIEDYETAINTSDVDRIMASYAVDAVEIRPNAPVFIGKEAIRSRKQQLFEDATQFHEDYVVKNVEISGDLAVAHVYWSASVTLRASGESINP